MSLNKTTIIGHIGKDAEVKDFGNNKVINFSVAVTRKWKNKSGEEQSKTTWFEVSKWGNNVTLSNYLTKGTQVYVEGEIEADAFVSNQDGEAKGVLRLNAFNIQLLGSNRGKSNQTVEPKDDYELKPEEEDESDLPF